MMERRWNMIRYSLGWRESRWATRRNKLYAALYEWEVPLCYLSLIAITTLFAMWLADAIIPEI